MRALSLFLCNLFLLPLVFGQHPTVKEAYIHFTVQNASSGTISIVKDNYSDVNRLFGNKGRDVVPMIDGAGQWSCDLSEPKFITTFYYDSIVDRNYKYVFYLSPGDELNFSFDSKNPEDTYAVKGKGSNNNQPAIQAVIQDDLDLKFYKRDSSTVFHRHLMHSPCKAKRGIYTIIGMINLVFKKSQIPL